MWTGEPGDQLVLVPFTMSTPLCAAIVGAAMDGLPDSRKEGLSEIMTLDPEGKISRQMIVINSELGHAAEVVLMQMESRLNELNTGEYLVCYATRQSGLDSPNDFFQLTGDQALLTNLLSNVDRCSQDRSIP